MCIVLNEAYQTLTDPDLRRDYNQALDEALTDEDDGYTGELLSKWCANTNLGKNTDLNEDRGVFVDELTCIGKSLLWFMSPLSFCLGVIEREFIGMCLHRTVGNLQVASSVCGGKVFFLLLP